MTCTLAVAPGEWVALIGANGSGKSTLTGLTVGLRQAERRGRCSFRGQPISPGKVFEPRRSVALLLQAADEMLFAETVLGELRVRDPVPGPAARAGAGRGRRRWSSSASAAASRTAPGS